MPKKRSNMKKTKLNFIALLSILAILFTTVPSFSAHLTWAQYKVVFKAYRYPATGPDSLMYRLCMPYHYDSTAKYPLVICLHGVGERGADDSIQIKNNCLATVWADSTVQNRFPHFIVAPQCPSGNYQWTQCSWNQNVVSYDTITLSKPLTMAMKLVDSLAKVYKSIDTNRLYIVGLSMGGWGTWDAITRYPGKFAAAIPICGGGDTSKVSRLLNMFIWTAVGSQDPTIPPQASRNLVNAIQAHGGTWVKTQTNQAWTTGTPTFTQFISQIQTSPAPQFVLNEYTDGQHDVWTPLLNDTLIFPWIFSKSKAATPVGENTAAIKTANKQLHTSVNVKFTGEKSAADDINDRIISNYSVSGRQIGKKGCADKSNITGSEVLIKKTE
jgi:predicted peptidase